MLKCIMKKVVISLLALVAVLLPLQFTIQQPKPVFILPNYLYVYPVDLGYFDSAPVSIITALNYQAQYGHNTWRLPTQDELQFMYANRESIGLHEAEYMHSSHTSSGIVRLVTTGKPILIDKAATHYTTQAINEPMTDQQRFAATTRAHAEANRAALLDKGIVVINGVRWADRNLKRASEFAARPEDYGGYFTWVEARTACPPAWRLPSKSELQTLRDAPTTWGTHNSVFGRFFGVAPYRIFMPVAGYRDMDGALNGAGQYGAYWSDSPYNSSNAYCMTLGISRVSQSANNYPKQYAFSVRCVAE
jgi:uncharacterized protein (TIGR02145 family)